MTWQIVRRAYGQYTVIETNIESWLDAETKAMKMQFENKDGEYLTFSEEETPGQRKSEYNAVQDAFAYL